MTARGVDVKPVGYHHALSQFLRWRPSFLHLLAAVAVLPMILLSSLVADAATTASGTPQWVLVRVQNPSGGRPSAASGRDEHPTAGSPLGGWRRQRRGSTGGSLVGRRQLQVEGTRTPSQEWTKAWWYPTGFTSTPRARHGLPLPSKPRTLFPSVTRSHPRGGCVQPHVALTEIRKRSPDPARALPYLRERDVWLHAAPAPVRPS